MTINYEQLRFLVRGGTSANLTTVNEVPLRRELVVETDTGRMKLGDGATAWNDLPYTSGGGGAPVEFQVSATHIQWRLADDTDWTNLIALVELQGEPGQPGEPGEPGEPGQPGEEGKSIELQASETHIQWRRVGDPSWINLAALVDLQGPPGADAVGAATRATITVGAGTSAVAIGKTALLLAITCSAAARVRLYCTAAARSADAARSANTAAPQGAGLLLEFIATQELLAAPLTPGVVAYNLDAAPTGAIYANVQPVGASADVTLTYLKLEN